MKPSLFVPLFCLFTSAQGQEPAALASFDRLLGRPESNSSLPAQVNAEPGKLTLFADFEHADGGWMPLYLVNRTNAPVSLGSQDGDTYIKLERQTSTGQWERVQTHFYSDCGNSYNEHVLPPGMHCRIRGYRPLAGTAAKVRYTGYSNLPLTSNTGDGFYTEKDLVWSQADDISRRGIPSSINSEFNLTYPEGNGDMSKRLTTLRMASLMGEIPAIRMVAEKWLAGLQAVSNPTDEQRQAMPVIQEILGSNWGERTGTQRLLEECFAAVKSEKQPSPEVGSLGKEQTLTWQVIYEIARSQTTPQAGYSGNGQQDSVSPIWKEILPFAARHVLARPGDANPGPQGLLLGIQPLADEFVSDDVCISLLANSAYPTVSNSTETLMRRNRWDKLADQMARLGPANQKIVFESAIPGVVLDDPMVTFRAAMNRTRAPREIRKGSEEHLFWKRLLKTNPLEVSSALFRIYSKDDELRRNPESRGDFKELFEYWQKEVENSDRQNSDFDASASGYSPTGSIAFIASWNNKEDVPLLRSLLRHRGYCMPSLQGYGPGAKPRPMKGRFLVREAAAKALEKMGETLPEGLIFETEPKIVEYKSRE